MSLHRSPYCACGTYGDIGHDGEAYCLPCYEAVVERMPEADWKARWLDENGRERGVPLEKVGNKWVSRSQEI